MSSKASYFKLDDIRPVLPLLLLLTHNIMPFNCFVIIAPQKPIGNAMIVGPNS